MQRENDAGQNMKEAVNTENISPGFIVVSPKHANRRFPLFSDVFSWD